MIGVLLAIFTFADGLFRCNTAPIGAIGRGVMAAALIVASLAWLWRSGVRLPWPAAALTGAIAALAVSDAYHTVCGFGLSTWIFYAGLLWGQRIARREWRNDFAIAGTILAAMIAFGYNALGGGATPLNRNMMAGALVALTPAMLAAPGRIARIVRAALISTALWLSSSRGAMLAAAAGLIAMFTNNRTTIMATAFSVAAGIVAMPFVIAIRPATMLKRLIVAELLINRVAESSPLFGLGPVFRLDLVGVDLVGTDAHSVLPTLLVMSGAVGATIISMAVAMLGTWRLNASRWQWATLIGVFVHSIIEYNVAWWPVGIVSALVLGSIREG